MAAAPHRCRFIGTTVDAVLARRAEIAVAISELSEVEPERPAAVRGVRC